MNAGVTAVTAITLALVSCARQEPRGPEPLRSSAWIGNAAIERGYIQPGDMAQFGCPSGWMGVDDTTAAVEGKQVAMTYRGPDPPPRDGTVTCVAQRTFALPAPHSSTAPAQPIRRPMVPVSLTFDPESTTITFARELPPSAAVYIGQDTPCGPRLIGVRLGDLLKWLTDPRSATTRDFLGLISAGCPG